MTPAERLVIVDLETTGLNPCRHGILQIARVVLDVPSRRIIKGLNRASYVCPTDHVWSLRDPAAMAVNGLTWEKLSGGRLLNDALSYVLEDKIDWSRAVLASWGLDFELKFLDAAYTAVGRRPGFPWKGMDVRSWMGFRQARQRLTDYLNLKDSARELSLEYNSHDAHDALYDANLTSQVALALLEER